MLARDTNTLERLDGTLYEDPVKAGALIFMGAMVALDANGWAVPATTAVGLKARGVAQEQVDNRAGQNGSLRVRVKRGVFCFRSAGGADALTRADIGATCFIVDDETVAKTHDTNTRSPAGIVRDVDAQGVWVQL